MRIIAWRTLTFIIITIILYIVWPNYILLILGIIALFCDITGINLGNVFNNEKMKKEDVSINDEQTEIQNKNEQNMPKLNISIVKNDNIHTAYFTNNGYTAYAVHLRLSDLSLKGIISAEKMPHKYHNIGNIQQGQSLPLRLFATHKNQLQVMNINMGTTRFPRKSFEIEYTITGDNISPISFRLSYNEENDVFQIISK